MMRYLLNSFLLLLLAPWVGLKAQTQQSLERDWRNDRQKVTIMSYNIMNGFSNGTDTDRMERFVAWVKRENPDVLALNELCGFTAASLKELAASYGHPYVAIVKERGYPVGVTSKTPIQVVAREIEGYGHGLLHCKVLGLDLLATHLNPNDRAIRKKEADNIVNYINKNNLKHCLLLGDMNAHSPYEAKWSNRDQADYTVIATFMAAGLYDACFNFTAEEQRYSFPTPILVSAPKGIALREQQELLDYIFVSGTLWNSCVDAQIYNGAENDYLSDHYPVGISLLLPKK